MSSYRAEPVGAVVIAVLASTIAVVLTMGLAFSSARATSPLTQQRGAGAPAPVLPGPAARDSNRQMDDYDRELNRLKNDAKAANAANGAAERRRSLFPQINEDFQRIQVIHNEIVRMLRTDKPLDYDRLIELTAEVKKRSNRLRTNLALPVEKNQESPTPNLEDSDKATELGVKRSLVTLHDLIVSFVTNPLFKNLGLLDVKFVTKASGDLRDIIQLSEDIKKIAETLNKTTKKT